MHDIQRVTKSNVFLAAVLFLLNQTQSFRGTGGHIKQAPPPATAAEQLLPTKRSTDGGGPGVALALIRQSVLSDVGR